MLNLNVICLVDGNEINVVWKYVLVEIDKLIMLVLIW